MPFDYLTDEYRTIPTRVGSTAAGWQHKLGYPDHPHAGGEHRDEWLFEMHGCGPSPRGWGALPPICGQWRALRTIPTRVGSTSASVSGALG